MGDTKESNERCQWEMWPDMCDRMASCHWIDGDDADCEWPSTTTGTPPPPGCCYIYDTRKQTLDQGWLSKCTALDQRPMTESTDANGKRQTIHSLTAATCGR